MFLTQISEFSGGGVVVGGGLVEGKEEFFSVFEFFEIKIKKCR